MIKDLTPNGNDGTVTGATVGSQYTSFDGDGDYITLDNMSFANEFTISLYEYRETTTEIIFDAGVSDSGQKLAISGGNFFVRVISSSDNTIISPIQVWQHIVLRRDNNNKIDLIVDNVEHRLYGDVAQAGTFNIKNIGYRQTRNDQFWNGKLSNFKIYNRALSDTEVKQLYDSTPKPSITEQSLNEGKVLDLPF